MTAYETTDAVHELLEVLGSLESRFMEGERALDDPQSVLEGYKWMFSILQVALDTQVWADAANPRFVEIVGPYKKWGGDNSDAYYVFAPLDPARTYRVRGTRGDAVYFSLTVYGGPRDGRYSERIVGTANDRTIDVAADGSFELVLGPERPEGWAGAFVASTTTRCARSRATTSWIRCAAAASTGTSSRSTHPIASARTTPTSPAASAPP